MEYGKTITLDVPFEDAVPRVKAAFNEQGFGILTEIDVKATLKEKIDADVDPYIILGACNPELARRALEIEPEIGLLLPCTWSSASPKARSWCMPWILGSWYRSPAGRNFRASQMRRADG